MNERTKQVRWWLLILITAITLYLCWLMIKPFSGVIAWATVLVIVFYPVHKRIEKRLAKPALSALISCVLVILVILVPIALITAAVIKELASAMESIQAGINYLLDPASPMTGGILSRLNQYVDVSQLQSEAYLLQQLKGVSGSIAGQTLGFLGGLASIIVQMFFVIFTMYYFFKDGDRIAGVVRDTLPLTKSQANRVLERTREVIDASVYGVISIAIIQGALGGLAFWVLGLRSAIIWAVAMAFLSMIPTMGAFLVWVPAAIYLALTGHYAKAIMLTVWGTLVIGMVDNFLRPKLVGSRTRMHELLIFFAVLGGLNVFGVLGVVLGPVVVAVTLAVVEVFRTVEAHS